jgi:hypothetical protein
VVGGVSSALSMVGAGALYGRFGAPAYYAMALAAAAGGSAAWMLARTWRDHPAAVPASG